MFTCRNDVPCFMPCDMYLIIVSCQYLSYGETWEVPTSHKHCLWPKSMSLPWCKVIWIKSRPLIRKVQNLCLARIFLWRNIGSSNTTQRSTWPKVIWLSLRSLEWKNYYLCLLCTVLKEKYGKFLFFSKNFRIIKVNHSKLPHVFVHCSS